MRKQNLFLIVAAIAVVLAFSIPAGAVQGILVGPDGAPLEGYSNVYIIDGNPQPVYSFAEHRWYNVIITGTDENGTPVCQILPDSSVGNDEGRDSEIKEPRQCFSGTTFVLMADGSKKMIKDITAGEKVMGYDFVSGRFTSCEVVDNYATVQNDYYILNGGLTVTAGHPFYARNLGPTPASLGPAPVTTVETQNLRTYATLYGFNPAKDSGLEKITLTSIIHVNGSETFYNLQADGTRNFFVSSDGICFVSTSTKLR